MYIATKYHCQFSNTKLTKFHKWKNTGQSKWTFKNGTFHIWKIKSMEQISPIVMAPYSLPAKRKMLYTQYTCGAGREKAWPLKALKAGVGSQSWGLNSELRAQAVKLKGHGHFEECLNFWLKYKTDDLLRVGVIDEVISFWPSEESGRTSEKSLSGIS